MAIHPPIENRSFSALRLKCAREMLNVGVSFRHRRIDQPQPKHMASTAARPTCQICGVIRLKKHHHNPYPSDLLGQVDQVLQIETISAKAGDAERRLERA